MFSIDIEIMCICLMYITACQLDKQIQCSSARRVSCKLRHFILVRAFHPVASTPTNYATSCNKSTAHWPSEYRSSSNIMRSSSPSTPRRSCRATVRSRWPTCTTICISPSAATRSSPNNSSKKSNPYSRIS